MNGWQRTISDSHETLCFHKFSTLIAACPVFPSQLKSNLQESGPQTRDGSRLTIMRLLQEVGRRENGSFSYYLFFFCCCFCFLIHRSQTFWDAASYCMKLPPFKQAEECSKNKFQHKHMNLGTYEYKHFCICFSCTCYNALVKQKAS